MTLIKIEGYTTPTPTVKKATVPKTTVAKATTPAVSIPKTSTIPVASTVGGAGNPTSTADVASNYQSYLDAIQADPVYSAALASFQNQSQASRSSLAAQIGQLVTQGGYDISGSLANDPTLASYAGDITPTIAAAAANNPLSQKAQIDQSYNQGLSDLAYEMASRGTVGSGASTAGASGLLQKTQLAHQNAQQTLIDAIRGGVTNYLGTLSSGQASLSDVMGQVAARLSQLPGGPLPTGDTTPAQAAAQSANAASSPQNQPGIRWANRLFQSVAQMKSYLSSVGVNYNDWAANHRDAANVLEAMS